MFKHLDPHVDNQQQLNELSLFSGAGGGILAGKLLGWRTVCAVEWEPYPAAILCARQNEGLLENFPIWDDVQTFDGKPWRGIVDVISGGFPCQDISIAGKGIGINGERSGMWKHMARIIGEVRPQFVFVENSPALIHRGLGTVLGNLSEMGYDAKWGIISAKAIGANHKRDRIWIVGNSYNHVQSAAKVSRGTLSRDDCDKTGESQTCQSSRPSLQHEILGDTESSRFTTRTEGQRERQPWGASIGSPQWWQTEPDVGRVANGVAFRVDRLKALGNGQVPLCAATAWNILSQ